MVFREECSEGSETTKSGTDEQERHTRHIESGKQAHHCNAQNGFNGSICRCRRDRMKENVLTRGGLGIDSVSMRQEVSRSHSTDWETSCIEEYGGLTGSGRAERLFVFEFSKEV